MTIKILCDAIPFCYGPAAALISLLKSLSQKVPASFTFDVLATGSTWELLARSNVPMTLLEVDSENRTQLAAFDTSQYDAFINVCNPVSYEVLHSPQLKTIYADFLLWMHEGPPADHFGSDLYLAENYPGTVEWVRGHPGAIPNLRVVAPLIKRANYHPTGGKLLVGLGGLISSLTPLKPAANYARFVVSCLAEAVQGTRFKSIVVACGEAVAASIGPQFKESKLRFRSLSHDEFLKELSCAEAFVSHPGLYAVFEAVLGRVPTALLPASNYTQILQLRHYRQIGLADYSFSWEDLNLSAIPSGLPEAEGVKRTIHQINEAQGHAESAGQLRLMLRKFLDLEPAILNELGLRQRRIASQFGTDGPADAARIIEEWFESRNA